MFFKAIIFKLLDSFTRPNNLIEDNGLFYVEINEKKCELYSQNEYGAWSFYGIIGRNPIYTKK